MIDTAPALPDAEACEQVPHKILMPFAGVMSSVAPVSIVMLPADDADESPVTIEMLCVTDAEAGVEITTLLPALVTSLAVAATVAFPAVKLTAVPVQFVSTPDVGVPNSGVTSVGDVAKTSDPDPVSLVTAAAKLAEVGVAKNVATPVPSPDTEPMATDGVTQVASVVLEAVKT